MMSCASGSCSSRIMRICMRTIAKPLRRLHGVMVMRLPPYVARAQVRKLEDSLLIESAPDEYFKTGLRESLMRAIDEQITYSKQETRDAVIWQARLNVAVVTASPDNVHADPTGDPGTEGPPGTGPLNPLYER